MKCRLVNPGRHGGPGLPAGIEGLGITTSTRHNDGLSGGQYRAYEIDYSVEMVLAAMSDLIQEVGVHEAVRDTVEKSDRISIS